MSKAKLVKILDESSLNDIVGGTDFATDPNGKCHTANDNASNGLNNAADHNDTIVIGCE